MSNENHAPKPQKPLPAAGSVSEHAEQLAITPAHEETPPPPTPAPVAVLPNEVDRLKEASLSGDTSTMRTLLKAMSSKLAAEAPEHVGSDPKDLAMATAPARTFDRLFGDNTPKPVTPTSGSHSYEGIT